MKNNEHFELVGAKKANEVLRLYSDYRLFWRSGFAFKGASEVEDDKQPRIERFQEFTFEQRMQRRYNWAAAIDIDIDHEKKEIHMNGFSANDLY